MNEEVYAEIVEPILAWYDQNKRDLPWRHTRDPYRIWLSEIMCQQTRIDTVIPYYERFLAQLPTVEDLASCDEQKLLKLWEGLGYYSRVRNMQSAAKHVLERGGFPTDAVDIASLQGIGEYTAGAIASIAFEAKEPAVDGNVLRVVSRVTGSIENIDKPATKRRISERLKTVYPTGRCGDFTQSLMELGALICIPNGEPKCGICPLGSLCCARQNQSTGVIPVRASKRARKVEERTVCLFVCGDRIALAKRQGKGLLASMWEYPNVLGRIPESLILEDLAARGVSANVERIGVAKHIFTHIEWRMTVYRIECDREIEGLNWVTSEEQKSEYPLPTAFRGCTELL